MLYKPEFFPKFINKKLTQINIIHTPSKTTMSYYNYPNHYQNQQLYFSQPPQNYQPAGYRITTLSTPSTYSRSEIKQEYESSAYSNSDLYSASPSSPASSFEDFENDYKPRGSVPKHYGKAFQRGKKHHEFLATMLMYLKEQFLSVNKRAIDQSYKFACQVEKMRMKKVMKEPLIKFLLEVVDEIVSVDEYLGDNMYADAVVKTENGSTVIIDWKTGGCYHEDFSKMESMLEEKNAKEGYIFYLDDGRYQKIKSKTPANPLSPFLESLSRPVNVPQLLERFGHTTFLVVLNEFFKNFNEPFNLAWVKLCLDQSANSWQDEGIMALRDSVRVLLN